MFFASDNWAGADDRINRAILSQSGFKSGYNAGEADEAVRRQLSELFETEVSVWFVATGTAANSIALALAGKPGGVAFGHEEAHILVDECGGPEFFSGGRLCAVPGQNGKMDPQALVAAIARYPAGFVHHGRPAAVSISQATELGTFYRRDELAAIVAIARAEGLLVHMDGARFANALVASGMTPAEMTWKAGVDLLSFGGTKNGCWAAEAIVCFKPELSGELAFHHKRAGQLFSKSRFIAAQFSAYLEDGHWLSLARHANLMTEKLVEGLRRSGRARLFIEPQCNETFVVLNTATATALEAAGAKFFEWALPASHAGALQPGEKLYRLITSFATTPEHVTGFLEALERAG